MLERIKTFVSNTALAARYADLNRWLQGLDGNPYVVTYLLSPSFDASKIDIRKVKGLLYLQTIVDNSNTRLLTFWKDEQAYDAMKDVFLANEPFPALPPTPHWTGIHRDSKVPTPGFWKKHWTTVGLVIAAVFAGISYIEKGNDFAAWAFYSPDLECPPTRPTDVLVGKDFDFEFGVRNRASRGTADVEFRSAESSSDDNANPQKGIQFIYLSGGAGGGIKPNSKEMFKVSGKAVQAGTYAVTIKGDARAGVLRGAKPLEFIGHVKVWRPLEIGDRIIKNATERLCKMEFQLLAGKAFVSGIAIEASLARTPGVEFAVLDFPAVYSWKEKDADEKTKGQEVSFIRWQTKNIEPMAPILFGVRKQESENSEELGRYYEAN